MAQPNAALTPEASIQCLKGIGPKLAQSYEKLGITTIAELLAHYPRRYIDYSHPYSPVEAPFETECAVKAELFSTTPKRYISGGRTLIRATAGDENGGMEISWFNNPYALNGLTVGETYYFEGTVGGTLLRRVMVNPVVRRQEQVASLPLLPVYPQTLGLNSNKIAKAIEQVLPEAERLLPDSLPAAMRAHYRLPDKASAVRMIHRPQSEEDVAAARRRLIYEELFILQLGIARMKSRSAATAGAPMRASAFGPFWAAQPYSPTQAQQRCIQEIAADLCSGRAMNRLLQGDVGSGKTLVAAAAIWLCYRNGYQSVLMAPTEILARQHAASLAHTLGVLGLRIALLTGGMKAAERRAALADIAAGRADLIVGTHAVLSEDVQYHRLGLAVIDEQHRFGVRQRGSLLEKANHPHLLVMSATPIPRTLGLLLYGDLDISILDELPPGRQPVRTRFVPGTRRADLYGFLAQKIDAGQQIYIVCPAIEDNEQLTGLNAVKTYCEETVKRYLPGRRVGLLHGRLRPKEKAAVMEAFVRRELDVLVSTTVIEVGVDVPNATVMVIENAERYGLSSLHQLRGRVGRGAQESWCMLLSDYDTPAVQERLRFLCKTADGFKVAEYDLQTRGPGDFFGHRQHGLPRLRIADLAGDTRTLQAAQSEAIALLAQDPGLEQPEHRLLAACVEDMFEKAGALN